MTEAMAKILSLQEAMELAKVFAESDLVPKEYRGKPSNCVIAIKMGEEVGLSPFQALQSIAVINGKPSLYGDAGLGILIASGRLESIDETDDGETATCTMKRTGVEKPVTRAFSMADAQRIQMYESDGRGGGSWKPLAQRTTWKNHPKRMRQFRARWWVSRDLFPDLLKGLRGVEEMEEATVIDVTPGGPGAPPAPPDEFGGMEPKETAPPVVEAEGAAPPVIPPEPEVIPTSGEPNSPQEVTPAMSVPDPVCVFELNGVQYQTAGVTKDQILTMFGLGPKANKKAWKGYDKELLKDKFGIETRKDLTAEQAEQYIALLTDAIEAE